MFMSFRVRIKTTVVVDMPCQCTDVKARPPSVSLWPFAYEKLVASSCWLVVVHATTGQPKKKREGSVGPVGTTWWLGTACANAVLCSTNKSTSSTQESSRSDDGSAPFGMRLLSGMWARPTYSWCCWSNNMSCQCPQKE